MRVAVVSDIHGNLHALEAVLAAIEGDAPDQVWCLGDLVGYGPKPNECCELVEVRATVCLCGNHDLGVLGTIDLDDFSGEAGVAATWTRGVLSAESRSFLDGLQPLGKAAGVALFHGSARDPVWEYVLSDEAALATLALAGSPLVLVGHSHVALHFTASAGEIFAEAALFATRYHCDAVAVLSSRVRVYRKANLLTAMRAEPALLEDFAATLAGQLQLMIAFALAICPRSVDDDDGTIGG